jgi:multidrug efflux pump subunit AcrA (membrane-fusion protein)
MFARISFPIGKKISALLVPKDALVLGGPSPVVYVIDEATMTVRPLPVETGVAVDATIQVKGPFQAGMKVVTKGNERLRPGQAVRLGSEG